MSRKAARSVPETLSRLLQGGFLKAPPPAFYPLLAHPPPPSLVRSLAPRDPTDLPPTASRPLNPYELAKAKLDNGHKLTPEDNIVLASPSSYAAPTSRRRPPRARNSRRNKPLPVVFPEDAIRKQFFRDHPFEAYRPVSLVEGEFIADEREPKGAAWTELSQRTQIPTAEDAIAFIQHLRTQFEVPLATAYHTGVAQFRTLRAEHETATRSAALQAQAHGAIFYTQLDRGLELEEKVLDQWANAREIQQRLASAFPVGPASAGMFGEVQTAPGTGAELEGPAAEPEFTGGVAYATRFANRGREADP